MNMYITGLVLVFSTVVGSGSGLMCPEGCRCGEPPSYIANCSNSGLTNIPQGIPSKSIVIDLSFNRITYLKEDLLGKPIKVNFTLILANNFIADIEGKAFFCQPLLVDVDLSYNNISRINSRILKFNTILAKLSFRGNKKLHLTHFGGFLQSESLRELDISRCNIGRVPNNTFVNLTNIERIDLSYNNITTLEPRAFAGLNNLNYLDISNNGLSAISMVILKSVLHLDQHTLKTKCQKNKCNANRPNVRLSNNPWTCGCEMKKVYEWCRGVGCDLVIICVKPKDLKSKRWEKLGEIEDCSDEVTIEAIDSRNNISGHEKNSIVVHKGMNSISLIVVAVLIFINFIVILYKYRSQTKPHDTTAPTGLGLTSDSCSARRPADYEMSCGQHDESSRQLL